MIPRVDGWLSDPGQQKHWIPPHIWWKVDSPSYFDDLVLFHLYTKLTNV